MVYAWLAAIVLFAVIEAATVQLVSIWLAVGAAAAFIGAVAGAKQFAQWILFVVFSALSLVITKPFVKRLTKNTHEKTNIDAQIGKKTTVTKAIDNIAETGEVKLGGISWTARSADGNPIATGDTVTVERVEGVKLIVSREG